MPSDFQTYVAQRLDHLEAGNRRLKRYAAAITVLVIGQGLVVLYLLLPVSGWLGVPKTIEASRFVLVDDRGRTRGTFVDDQGPALSLLTEDGQSRAVLWVNHDGAATVLLMDNRNGAGRVASVSASDDAAGVELSDQKGERLTLILSEKQSGLQLPDKKGRPTAATQP